MKLFKEKQIKGQIWLLLYIVALIVFKMLYATVFSETSIMDIKSRCLSLQCGTDSKLVDTDCWFYLPVICSDRKISMYISSSYNIYTQLFTYLLYSYISQKIVLLPFWNCFIALASRAIIMHINYVDFATHRGSC